MPVAKSLKSQINIDNLLTNAADALSMANNFASLIPVPVVSSLVQAAQNVVTVAQVSRYRLNGISDGSRIRCFQVVKSNKRACAQLARKAAELTSLISEVVHAREGHMDKDLHTAIASLQR